MTHSPTDPRTAAVCAYRTAGDSPLLLIAMMDTLSLSWRSPMRESEPEKMLIGIPLPDLMMDQFMDLEDSWSTREERV